MIFNDVFSVNHTVQADIDCDFTIFWEDFRENVIVLYVWVIIQDDLQGIIFPWS